MINCNANNILYNGALLTRMSHEVRTNMNYILAYSFFMEQQDSPLCNTEMSSQIRNSCKQLLGIVDNFIESMMVDNGSTTYSPKVCNLSDFANQLFDVLDQSVSTENEKDICFSMENDISKEVKGEVDSGIITKILENIVYISLLNTDHGYIKLHFGYDNKTLNISVTDSGNGYMKCKDFIDNENIMTPFSMYNDAATAININFTKQLIKKLNGSISVKQNENDGTCFMISIPLKKRKRTSVFDEAAIKAFI